MMSPSVLFGCLISGCKPGRKTLEVKLTIYPDLLSQLASDVAQTLLSVEAHSLETAVAQHLDNLCVFCV